MFTTVSIISLQPGFGPARWALAQMGTAPAHWARVPGLGFGQLLGSGAAGGFGAWPHWHRYGFIATWETAAAADAFFAADILWQRFRQRSIELFTARLAPLQGHGAWNGRNPFVSMQSLTLP